MLDVILPYASIAMLSLLGVFVLFGALFGMGRGVKRAGLRLGIFVGLLVVALLLTPVVAGGLLGINISINGQTPTEWVDSLSDNLVVMLQESLGQYMAPFGPYIKEYAVGLVLAFLNIILFFLMYIVIKIISWIIYAIVARFVAPKRDKDGNKNKKHVWWGALVGMVQGVLLFVLFLLPIHGVIGVVNQAAQYQDKAGQDTQPQAVTTSAYDDDDNNSQIDLSEVFAKVNDSMKTYNNVMRYSGLQFLSNKAFAYQLTVRVKGSDSINLVHDINTAWELYVDSENLGTVIQKVGDIADTYDFSLLTAKDYQILRNYVNKAFDIQLLHIADHILGDLDDIFNQPFNEENHAKLAGTEIYEDSIYGMIITQMATERKVEEGVNVNQAYADGLQSMVKYVAKQKLDLVRHDAIALIDFAEAVTSYKFTFDGKAQTLSEVMNGETLDWRGYLDLVTARLSEKQGGYAKDTAMVSVLGDRLKGFSFVQMLGKPHVENLVVYNKMLDGFFTEENHEMGDLIAGLAKMFLGDKAFTKGNEKGNWEKLGGVLLDVADVVRDNKDLIDDIMKLFSQESGDDEADVETRDDAAGEFDIQAIFKAISKLIISEEYYEANKNTEFKGKEYNEIKYNKVDQLVGVLYDALDTLQPVKNFLISYLNKMAGDDTEGNMFSTLADMLAGEKEDWEATFHTLVSAANLMNNETIQGIFEKLQGGDGEGSDLTEKDLAELLDTVVNELNGEDVANLLETVLDMGGIGDTVKGILGETLNGIVDEYLDNKTLGEIFGEETIMVGEEEKKIAAVVKDNLEKLADYFGDNEKGLTSEKMKAAVEELWTAVQNSKAIKDMLKGLPNGSEGQVETQQLAA